MRRLFLRALGAFQLCLCLGILIGMGSAYQAYERSIDGIFLVLSETTLTACDTITLVARSVDSRQQVLNDIATTLRSYHKTSLEVGRSVKQFESQLLPIASSLKDLEGILRDANALTTATADAMDFSVPDGVTFETIEALGQKIPIRPKVTYS